MVLALQQRINPDIEPGHHGQVPPNLLQLLLMVVQVDWLDSEEVLAVLLVEAVEEHAVEILVELRGGVLH